MFDFLRELDRKRNGRVEELRVAEIQKVESFNLWSKQLSSLAVQKKEFDAVQGDFTQKQFKLKDVLADREINDWRNIFFELKEKKILLEEVSGSVQSLSEARQVLNELGRYHEKLISEMDSLSHQIQEKTAKHVILEREICLLETQFSLLKRIQDFEEVRHHLQDEEPCPLCGAREHPFAKGNIPVLDETTAALNHARVEFKQENDALSDLKIKEVETFKDIERTIQQKKECTEKIITAEACIQKGFSILSLDVSIQESESTLLCLRETNGHNLEIAMKVVQVAEGYEKEIVVLSKSLEKKREANIQSERDLQAAAHKKESDAQTVDRAKKELEMLVIQCQKALGDTLCDVSSYGFKNLSISMLDPVQFELAKRRDQWIAWQKQKTDIEKHITTSEVQIQNQNEQIRKSESELKNQQNALSALIYERDTLFRQRRELFGDKNSNDEEARLSKAIEDSEKHLEVSRQTFNSADQVLAKIKTQAEALEKAVVARAEKLITIEEEFRGQLGKFGFSTESSYQSACLPEDERKKLMHQVQQLATEEAELEARRRDKISLLETEKKKKITSLSRELLAQELECMRNSLSNVQQDVWSIKLKLENNESLRHKQQERINAIDAQERECSRWDKLHELIGSSDGKKYRNFAQGLTFEMLIGHANRQLQKMTDRYLLIKDDRQPLELNVVDNYQAGEIRSTKNLSGGENFIISLSLALGLSQMASKNVRVDSLFLDEGFGTLDEEALDTALETLSALQQYGKLIGVISHVPALKERINTQIQVIPQAGGKSVISGPGCSNLNQ